MAEEEQYIICGPPRMAAFVPGSVVMPCSRCGRPVAVAPRGQAFLAQEPDARLICWLCAPMVVGPDEFVGLTEGQRQEIEAAIGRALSDAEIRAMVARTKRDMFGPVQN